MPIDFNHPYVGRKAIYTASHPGAQPQEGVITSVNEEANIAFLRYGTKQTSAATAMDDRLKFLDGSPVVKLGGELA